MIKKTVNTVQEALDGVEDNMTFMLGGFGLSGIPENAIAELVKRNTLKAKYVLIGKGKLEQDVRQQVKDLNLEEHIIFAGFRKNIPELLPEFDLFMFTSNNEPTGGVLLESYACKVPIVAANAGGIPEVIVDNEKNHWNNFVFFINFQLRLRSYFKILR